MLKYLFCLLVLVGCQQNMEEAAAPEKKEKKRQFEMYELSEMSALMRQMYQLNEQLKVRILAGEDLGTYPESFERILEAAMTDNKQIDDFFKEHAALFLASQKSIFDQPEQAKELFNTAVDACVQCHRVKCAGPIPKIERLYIK